MLVVRWWSATWCLSAAAGCLHHYYARCVSSFLAANVTRIVYRRAEASSPHHLTVNEVDPEIGNALVFKKHSTRDLAFRKFVYIAHLLELDVFLASDWTVKSISTCLHLGRALLVPKSQVPTIPPAPFKSKHTNNTMRSICSDKLFRKELRFAELAIIDYSARNLDHALFEGLGGTGIMFTVDQYCKLRRVHCGGMRLAGDGPEHPACSSRQVQGEALAFIARFVNISVRVRSAPLAHSPSNVIEGSLRFYCHI